MEDLNKDSRHCSLHEVLDLYVVRLLLLVESSISFIDGRHLGVLQHLPQLDLAEEEKVFLFVVEGL